VSLHKRSIKLNGKEKEKKRKEEKLNPILSSKAVWLEIGSKKSTAKPSLCAALFEGEIPLGR
jgi:hypothetical protein